MCYRHAEIVFEIVCPNCGARNENYRLTCQECGAELPDCETPEECADAGVGVIEPTRPPEQPRGSGGPKAPPNPKFISGW